MIDSENSEEKRAEIAPAPTWWKYLEEANWHDVTKLFPLLDEKELKVLAEDIKVNGLQQPIVLYDEKVLDGRNRALACRMAGVNPVFLEFETSNATGPVAWVISQNLHRRHLTASQRAACAVEALPLLEEEARQRRKGNGKVEIFPPRGKSREIAAAMFGTSDRYVQDAKKIGQEAPDLLEDVRRGERTIQEAKKEIRVRERKKILASAPPPVVWSGKYDLNSVYVADIRDLHQSLEAESVHMIFTDPPWSEDGIELFSDLGKLAARVLKPGGFCISFVGTMFLPQVLVNLLKHLEYIWTFAAFQSSAQDKVHARKIFQGWRPIVVFKKQGESAWQEWTADTITSERQKDWHPHQQCDAAPLAFIPKFSKPGDLILDPFSGGGTISAVCKSLSRRFLAFDKDEEAVRATLKRLEGVTPQLQLPLPLEANVEVPPAEADQDKEGPREEMKPGSDAISDGGEGVAVTPEKDKKEKGHRKSRPSPPRRKAKVKGGKKSHGK